MSENTEEKQTRNIVIANLSMPDGKKYEIPFFGSKKGAARKKKIKIKELSVFNRQLSVMFNAGLPITQGLGILIGQQKNKYFKSVIAAVRNDVESGSNFSYDSGW